jgi:hypothetical protein
MRATRLPVAKPIGAADSGKDRKDDSGAIDLNFIATATTVGSSPSGPRASLSSSNAYRMLQQKQLGAPLWVWVAGGAAALFAIVVLIALVRITGNSAPPPSPRPTDTSGVVSPRNASPGRSSSECMSMETVACHAPPSAIVAARR